ncbi:MAG TPA: hypothetical protein VFV34_29435 [Blastocatellia bacterium]|nr:hypothetical protein [Blastocatellia bacterium]
MKKQNNPSKLLIVLAASLVILILGAECNTASAQIPDPSQRGPFATTNEEYNLGDTAFTPTGFPAPVEIRGVVFHPVDLTGGPFPLVVFVHGRHSTCFSGSSSFLEWPCAAGHSPITSFRGYDYAADLLASNGYFVVSISVNGINARDNNTADLGAQARAELIQRHLDLWNQFNTVGGTPFGTTFVGKVDLTRIGTMGHSRGGEGVLRHFILNKAAPSPYPIKVVVPIAPTNFSRWQVNDGVAVAQLLSYCDGDVNNIQGVHAYDDARYKIPNSGFQQYVAVMGANHNFFNTVWTPGNGFPASDDWTTNTDPFCGTGAGNGRLTAAQQRSVASAYLPTYFRSQVGGETVFKPLIDGGAGLPPSVSTLNLHVSFQDNDTRRRDVNRLLTATDLTSNILGGAVTQTGLSPYDLCGGDAPQPQHCLTSQSTARQPHTAPSNLSTLRGLSQLRFGWNNTTAIYTNNIPAGTNRNISGFEFLQFRATVNFTDTRNVGGQPQDLSVRFTDETGASQSLRVGQFSDALFFPPGTTGAVPKVWHNTARIPIGALTSVDTTRITKVDLVFDQKATGALLVSDLHFSRGRGTVGSPVLFFDDFETNQGWVRNPNNTDTATTGLWERGDPEATDSIGPKQLGTAVSGLNDLVTGRLAGASAGANDVDGGTTSIQSPTITLTGGTTYTLSLWYYFAHGSNSSSADFFRISVVTATGVTRVFEELGNTTDDDAAWRNISINLSQFGGQKIILLIETADAAGASLVEAAVDDVKITRQ